MEVGYSRLVTISTDNMLLTNEYRDGVGAHWTFLSDPGRKVQKDLDIAEYTDPEHNPMIPHVIVLEPGLVIFKVYNGYWFFGRPIIEELRQDLRAVLKKCRQDWDITRPELKAAWERGEQNRFYPYGKTYGRCFGSKSSVIGLRLFDNPGFQMAYRKRTSPTAHEEQSDCEQPQAAEELCGDHQEG